MKYRVSGLPSRGAGAFMPGLTLNGQSYGAGLNRNIAGFPGTAPVAVDHDMVLAPLSFDPKTQPSNVAPDVILPDVYIPGTRYMGPWAARGAVRTVGVGLSGNPMPEPAGAPSGVPIPAAQPARIGGQAAIGWPRVDPQFPSVNSASN